MSHPPKSVCCGAPVRKVKVNKTESAYACVSCDDLCNLAPPQLASDEEWYKDILTNALKDAVCAGGHEIVFAVVGGIVTEASRRGAKEAIEGIIEKTNSYLDLLKRDTNREPCMDCYQLLRKQLNELKKRYDAS